MQTSTNSSSIVAAPAVPAPPAVRLPVRVRFLGWLRTILTPVLVFAALGGLFVWGHWMDWTLPRFSSLMGTAPSGRDDWCSEHNVPESVCVECNPELMPRPKAHGWCEVHGVHECPLEHPEVAQTRVPPKVTADDLVRAQRALEFAERTKNNSRCKSHERRIQFTSQEAVERAGIKVEAVWRGPVVEFVTGNGETTYDQTRTARLSPRAAGTVIRAFKKIGDPIQQGEVIALVDAADVGKAKSEFLTALVQVRLRKQTLERMHELYTSGAVSERAIRDQAAALSEAKIRLTAAREAMTNLGLPVDVQSLKDVPQEQLADRLRFLGLPGSLLSSLDPTKTSGNLLAITAPFDGVVIARQVVGGDVVDSSKVLFVVADVRQLWLALDLRLEDAKAIRLGQKVRFRPDGSKEEADGSITWISTEIDHKTRTVKARAILDNKEGHLRANTFGAARVILREETQAIVVPNQAVHWEGDCFVVFVQDKNFSKPGTPKVFHTRTVRLGARDQQQTEIIAGVLPNELVASTGSESLRAELLRGNLGEG